MLPSVVLQSMKRGGAPYDSFYDSMSEHCMLQELRGEALGYVFKCSCVVLKEALEDVVENSAGGSPAESSARSFSGAL